MNVRAVASTSDRVMWLEHLPAGIARAVSPLLRGRLMKYAPSSGGRKRSEATKQFGFYAAGAKAGLLPPSLFELRRTRRFARN